MANNGNIVYTVGDIDRVVEEKGNTFIALRHMKWCEASVDKEFKLDLRKYYMNSEGGETVSKGISFATEEGPHELTRVLAEEGFGHTDEIIEAIKNRDDFMPSLVKALNGDDLSKVGVVDVSEYQEEDYYDPRKDLLSLGE